MTEQHAIRKLEGEVLALWVLLRQLMARIAPGNIFGMGFGGTGLQPVPTGGLVSTQLILTGLSLFPSPRVGELGYFSGDNTISRAIATAKATATAVGVYAGTANALSNGPRVPILLEAGLTLVAGQRIYVSKTIDGRGTNIAPTTGGQVEAEVAILANASGYDAGAGSAQDCLWQPKTVIQL